MGRLTSADWRRWLSGTLFEVVFLLVCASGFMAFLLGAVRQSTGLVVLGLLVFCVPFLVVFYVSASLWIQERRSPSSRAGNEKSGRRQFSELHSGLILGTWFLGWMFVAGFGDVSHIRVPLVITGLIMSFGPLALFAVGGLGFLLFAITTSVVTSLLHLPPKKPRDNKRVNP
jgi:hypothetical protein